MTTIKVLILEDRPADAELVVEELRRHGFEPEWVRVDTEADFLARLGEAWDAVLVDFSLPGFDGLSALAHVQAGNVDTPVIVVSGSLPDELAVGCLKSGASDYVLKDRLGRLGSAVERALRERRMREEKRRADEALRSTAQRLQALLEASPLAVIVLDAQGFVTLWNPAAERVFGWTEEEVLGGPLPTVPEGGGRDFADMLARTLRGEPLGGVQVRRRRKDGTLVEVSLFTAVLRDAAGAVTGSVGMLTDITEKNRLEGELRQAQKMEAVGRLAGGIAHDFNNLLTVISGRADIALARLPETEPARRDIELVRKTAERAAALTRQLLAFSRRQALETRVLDLNAVVDGLLPLLRRLIGEDIDLVAHLDSGAGSVKADPSQIEQVLLNLVVNARDAMPTGGVLAITTTSAAPDPGAGTEVQGPAGPCAMLAVSDTGQGMDAETRSRIFEPFFTTKEAGKGTGLGLSTVYGIVRQHGGAIDVESAPGEGTTFRVFLPRVEGVSEAVEAAGGAAVARNGSETVLLVEDEEGVRRVAVEILQEFGYEVLEATEATGALLIAERHPGPVHLLLTDVIMPQMGGPELAGRIGALRPGIRVLYMSGYTGEALGERGAVAPDVALLHKPFTPAALGRAVREALDHGE